MGLAELNFGFVSPLDSFRIVSICCSTYFSSQSFNSHSFFLSRQQGELEKLNQSTDDINRWETELEVGLACLSSVCACFFVIVLLFSSRTVAATTTEGRPFFQTGPGFS